MKHCEHDWVNVSTTVTTGARITITENYECFRCGKREAREAK